MYKKTIGIAIPAYNNPDHLRTCLESFRSQSNKSFTIHIFDDASTVNIKNVVDDYYDLDIEYTRSLTNRGALENMAFSYEQSYQKYDYLMVMHQDDVVSSNFISAIYTIVSSVEKEPSFIISCFKEFPESFDFEKDSFCRSLTKFWLSTKQEICNRFISNNNIAFGSAVYNTAALKTINFDLQAYGEFADRPFLLSLLDNDGVCCVIEDPIYGLRSHGESDSRWKRLTSRHVFNTLWLYREILLKTKFINRKEFKVLSSGFIIDCYKNLKLTGNAPVFLSYLISAYKLGLVSIKSSVLKQPAVNRSVTKIISLLK